MNHDAPASEFRYFYEGVEVSEAQIQDWERQGRAHVRRGGSGVVPEELRQPGETREQWLTPWMELAKGPPFCVTDHKHQPTREEAIQEPFKSDRVCAACRSKESAVE